MKQRTVLRTATMLAWTTAALTAARLCTLIVLEIKLRHRDPDVVLWDISHQAGLVTLHALCAATLMLALAHFIGRS